MFPRSTDRRFGWQDRPAGTSEPRLPDQRVHWHHANDLDMSHGKVGLMEAIEGCVVLVCESKQDRHLDHVGLDGDGTSSLEEGSKTRKFPMYLRKFRIG